MSLVMNLVRTIVEVTNAVVTRKCKKRQKLYGTQGEMKG